MISDLALFLVGAVLVNNFVLVQFLGLCPFMGVSTKLESALGMAMATTFVLTLTSACTHLVFRYVLAPLGLEYLQTISFILVIAAVWACACGGNDGLDPFEGEVGTIMFVTQVPVSTDFAVRNRPKVMKLT